MGFAVRVISAGQKYGPTCHQRDRADVTEFVTLVRLSSLGQHVGVLALAGYKRRKSALTAGPIPSMNGTDQGYSTKRLQPERWTRSRMRKSIRALRAYKAGSSPGLRFPSMRFHLRDHEEASGGMTISPLHRRPTAKFMLWTYPCVVAAELSCFPHAHFVAFWQCTSSLRITRSGEWREFKESLSQQRCWHIPAQVSIETLIYLYIYSFTKSTGPIQQAVPKYYRQRSTTLQLVYWSTCFLLPALDAATTRYLDFGSLQ